jgi:putative addiction module component (TIGR02574 family)
VVTIQFLELAAFTAAGRWSICVPYHHRRRALDMTEAAERMKAELSRLSLQDRADLASFLIHSLDEDVDNDVETAWDAELGRRLTDISSGTAVGTPAETVFAELRAKYS